MPRSDSVPLYPFHRTYQVTCLTSAQAQAFKGKPEGVETVLPTTPVPSRSTIFQSPVNLLTLPIDELVPIYSAAFPWDNFISRQGKDFLRLPFARFPRPTLPRFDVLQESTPAIVPSQHFWVSNHNQQGLRPCNGN